MNIDLHKFLDLQTRCGGGIIFQIPGLARIGMLMSVEVEGFGNLAAYKVLYRRVGTVGKAVKNSHQTLLGVVQLRY